MPPNRRRPRTGRRPLATGGCSPASDGTALRGCAAWGDMGKRPLLPADRRSRGDAVRSGPCGHAMLVGPASRLAGDDDRDPLLPDLKRLRREGCESRGRVAADGHDARAVPGRKKPVRRGRGRQAPLLEAERGTLPRGGRGRRRARTVGSDTVRGRAAALAVLVALAATGCGDEGS